MKVFFDTEFTGLHKDTTLISIGLVSDSDKEFYAELTDYDDNQVDDWIQEHVINNLMFDGKTSEFTKELGNLTLVRGDKEYVGRELKLWFSNFNTVETWSDCHHYDVVLLHDIFGGAFSMPEHVYYIPYDICTVMKMFRLDPDISREAFIDEPIAGAKHNALYDAKVIRACYDKLRRNKHKYKTML